MAVGAGLVSGRYRFEKVFTFCAQWFKRFDLDKLSLFVVRNRDISFPFDGMRIKEQFMLRFKVVKNCHLTVADYNEPLFFILMDPRNEYMSAYLRSRRVRL